MKEKVSCPDCKVRMNQVFICPKCGLKMISDDEYDRRLKE